MEKFYISCRKINATIKLKKKEKCASFVPIFLLLSTLGLPVFLSLLYWVAGSKRSCVDMGENTFPIILFGGSVFYRQRERVDFV